MKIKTANVLEVVQALQATNPGLLLGMAIGAGIGLNALASAQKRREPFVYRLAPNPANQLNYTY